MSLILRTNKVKSFRLKLTLSLGLAPEMDSFAEAVF